MFVTLLEVPRCDCIQLCQNTLCLIVWYCSQTSLHHELAFARNSAYAESLGKCSFVEFFCCYELCYVTMYCCLHLSVSIFFTGKLNFLLSTNSFFSPVNKCLKIKTSNKSNNILDKNKNKTKQKKKKKKVGSSTPNIFLNVVFKKAVARESECVCALCCRCGQLLSCPTPVPHRPA